jgi:hypothetical protein
MKTQIYILLLLLSFKMQIRGMAKKLKKHNPSRKEDKDFKVGTGFERYVKMPPKEEEIKQRRSDLLNDELILIVLA